jgi:hypothetical protein
MLDRIRQVPGVLLDRRSYHERMHVETSQLNGVVWKLERSQVFTEAVDDPAWEAFISGDWLKSVAIFESERRSLQAEAEKYARQGSEFRRLRIVEPPVSAYLQWELQSLKIFDESGMPIRILDASSVRDLEGSEQLPEIVIVGDQVLYEVRYDSQWSACGARRITDRDVIRQATADMAALWAEAEPLAGYFVREIATLPPPRFG